MKKAKSELRGITIRARISETEHQKILEKQQASGLSTSEFTRRALLGADLSGSGAKNQKAMEHLCEIQTFLNQARQYIDCGVLDELQEEVSQLCRCLL